MDWKKDWIGKRIFVKLIDGAVYSESLVLDVDELFFKIRDKFGEIVYFKIDKIDKIKEEGLR